MVVREEKSVLAEAENISRAAVDLRAVEEAGDEVMHGAAGRFFNPDDAVASTQAPFRRSVQSDEKRTC